MNTSGAKFHQYDQKMAKAIEMVEEELSVVKNTGMVNDFTKLMDLYQSMITRERKMALNGMYLGDRLASTCERLHEEEDPKAINEITTILKAL